jgi:hypothetical protein
VALHKDLPESPYAILDADFGPFQEDDCLREICMDGKLDKIERR